MFLYVKCCMSIWGYRSVYNEMINSAFGAEDFHLSVFKQEEGLEKEIFWGTGTM